MAFKKAVVNYDGQWALVQTGDTVTAPAFLTGGNYTSGQDYLSSSAVWIGATTGAGSCYLRPNGTGSTTGQMVLTSVGDVSVSGHVKANAEFISSTTAVMLCTDGSPGTVLLRPNGVAATAGEMSVQTGGNVIVNGSNVQVANPAGHSAIHLLGSGANTGYVQFANVTTGNLALIDSAVDTLTIGTGVSNVTRMTLNSSDVTFTVSLTSSGRVTASQNFASSTTTAVLGSSAAGTVYLRPNGVGSATGQLQVAASGDCTVANNMVAVGDVVALGNTFAGAATVELVCNTGGTVYLRPNTGSTTGQVSLDSTGLLTVNGDVDKPAYGEAKFRTGNAKGRINHAYYDPTDYFTFSANYDRTGAATGTIDHTSLSTAEIQVMANNGSAGLINLMVGAVNTAPSNIMVIASTGVTVTGTASDSLGNVRLLPLSNRTASFTLALGDAYYGIMKNNSTAQTHTVPPNSSVAFPIGTLVTFTNLGGSTNNLTIARGAGVTIYKANTNADITLTPGNTVTLWKYATDAWQST